MIKRRRDKKTIASKDETRVLTARVPEAMAHKLEELAEEQGVSVSVLMDKALALLFDRYRQSLPPSLMERLEAHGRPVLRTAGRKAKSSDLN